MNYTENVYIHQNFNRNQLKEFLVDNTQRIVFIKDWIPNTYYRINDISYNPNNNSYLQAIINHTSSNSLGSDLNKWVVVNNPSYRRYPTPNDVGLIHYDTHLNRLVVWDGSNWKVITFLDDTDYVLDSNVSMSDVWTDSNLIPINEAYVSQSNIIQKHDDINLIHIPNTYNFRCELFSSAAPYPNGSERLAINNIVPPYYDSNYTPFNNQSFYNPIIKTYNGYTISATYGWKLIGDTVYFLNGFPKDNNILVSDVYPPKISFYEYIGNRLTDLVIVAGQTNIFEVYGVNGTMSSGNTYSLPSPMPVSSISDIKCIYYQGLNIFNTYKVDVPNRIDFNLNDFGYQIDNDDVFYIELKN